MTATLDTLESALDTAFARACRALAAARVQCGRKDTPAARAAVAAAQGRIDAVLDMYLDARAAHS